MKRGVKFGSNKRRSTNDLVLIILLIALVPVVLYLFYSIIFFQKTISLSPGQDIMVLNITFNDGTVDDFSGLGNDGVLMNGAQIVDDSLRTKILDLNGNGYMNVSNDPTLNFGTGNFSVSVWVKATSSIQTFIFDKGYNLPGSGGYVLYVGSGDPAARLEIWNNGKRLLTSHIPNSLWMDGTWHNLAFVVNRTAVNDAGKIIGYLDGVHNPATMITWPENGGLPAGLDISSSNDLIVGADSGATMGFNGDIDDLKIYNYALTLRQIEDIYSHGDIQPPSCVDSDGDNIYVKGHLTSDVTGTYIEGHDYANTDEFCSSTTGKLIEFTCYGPSASASTFGYTNDVYSNSVDCPFGYKCNNGACTYTPLRLNITFNDGTANDASAYANNGVLKNGAIIVDDPKKGKVLQLDGIDDYIVVPTADDDSLKFEQNHNFTISFWTKSLNQVQTFVLGNAYYDNGPGFDIYTSTATLDLTNGSTDHVSPVDNPAPVAVGSAYDSSCSPNNCNKWLYTNPDQWAHVAFVIERGSSLKITTYVDYTNGTVSRVGSAIYPNSWWDSMNTNPADDHIDNEAPFINATSSKDLLIGASYPAYGTSNSPSGFFNGLIDDIKIYGRALSQQEIQNEMERYCGDGKLQNGESCDDKNIVAGDGCSASCVIESGYTCTGQPSVCSVVVIPDDDPGNGGPSCVPNWSCAWTVCVNNVRNYSCYDSKNCGTSSGKPSQTIEACSIVVTCIDADGDGYGIGTSCLGPDPDDNNPNVTAMRNLSAGNLSGQPQGASSADRRILLFLLFGVLIVAVVIISVLAVRYFMNSDKRKVFVSFSEGKSFVEAARRSGYKNYEIKTMLLERGWNSEDADKVLEGN